VVICEGFVDAAIVRYRAIGLEEQRLARVAQWAVNGLKPDLTLVVDPPSGNGRATLTAGESAVANETLVTEPVVTEKPDAAASNGAVSVGPVAPDMSSVASAVEVENEEAVSGLALAGEALAELAAPGQEVPERVEPAAPAAPTPSKPAASQTTHSPTGDSAADTVVDERSGQADDDDEQVDPAQAYRDRASYAPERYIIVQPHLGRLLPEVVERLESVVRQRTPALADPQHAASPRVARDARPAA
jgi:dTMP kinase